MRAIGRDAAEILLGDALPDWHLPLLIKFLAIQKQNRYSSINAKLFIFLLWLVIHNFILLATVFIIEVPILNLLLFFLEFPVVSHFHSLC